MNEWRKVKLDNILEKITKGTTPPKGVGFVDKGINYIKSDAIGYDGRVDIEKFVQINFETHEKFKRSQLKEDDILFSMAGAYLGKNALVKKEMLPANTNQALAILRLNKNLTLPRYINYYLIQPQMIDFVNNMSGQSAQPNINFQEISSIDLLLPSLKEQKAIAEVLSSLDDKIDLLHRQNKTLEELAQTLFRQWFIKEAKDEWEEVKIKDFDVVVTDYVANGSFASLAENVNYKQVPDFAKLIRLTDYNRNFRGDFVYVDEHAYNFLNKSKLYGGEIIISNVGAYAGTVFKAPKLNQPMTLGPNSIVLKSDFNNYFYLFFKSEYGRYLLDGIMSGSAQPKFNKTAFRGLTLNYPFKQYIVDFENTIKPYFIKIEANQKQIETLESMRDTLLPKLMSGEVRVKI